LTNANHTQHLTTTSCHAGQRALVDHPLTVNVSAWSKTVVIFALTRCRPSYI